MAVGSAQDLLGVAERMSAVQVSWLVVALLSFLIYQIQSIPMSGIRMA